MSAAGDDRSGRPRRRRMEIFAFLFLTAVLMPRFGGRGRRQLRICGVDLSDGGRSARPSQALIATFQGSPPWPNLTPKSTAAPSSRAACSRRIVWSRRPAAKSPAFWCRPGPSASSSVEAAIVGLDGCEVYGRDPKGKLVVVVDAPDAGSLGRRSTPSRCCPTSIPPRSSFTPSTQPPDVGRNCHDRTQARPPPGSEARGRRNGSARRRNAVDGASPPTSSPSGPPAN